MFGFFNSAENNQKKFLKSLWIQDFETARACISKGADINKGLKPGDEPPIMQAVKRMARHSMDEPGYASLQQSIEFLMDAGAFLFCADNDGNGLMHHALDGKNNPFHSRLMNRLLDAGFSLGGPRNMQGRTPLHVAAGNATVARVLDELVKRPAAPQAPGLRDFIDAPDRNGNTALHVAVQARDSAGIRALLKYGANPALKNDDKASPLDLAGDFDSLYALAENRRTIDSSSPALPPLVEMAVTENNTAFLDFLKEKEASPFSMPACRVMDLPRLAVLENNFQALGWLLKNGFDGSLIGPEVFPLVELIVSRDRVHLLEQLKDSGIALAGLPGSQEARLLHLALEEGSGKALQWLLENGFDPDRPDESGDYPLHLAVREEDEKALARILARASAVDVRDNDGCTPLSMAVWGGNVDAVCALLKAGADPCQIDGDGNTLLHALVHSDDCSADEAMKIARLLLEAGCDPTKKNGDGYTVRELAEDADEDGILRALRGFARAQKKKMSKETVTGDTITFVRALPEKRVLVESFNFATRERTVIMENHALKAISAPACESFDVIRDKSVLEKAHAAYAAAGGNIPCEVIHAPPRRMEPLLPPRK